MTAAIQEILTNLTTNEVDAKILEDAKNYLIGSLPLRFSTTLSLSGAAIRMQMDGRKIDALDQWADNIAKVTADDIRNVANRVFVNKEPTVTIITGAVPEDGNFELIDTIAGIE